MPTEEDIKEDTELRDLIIQKALIPNGCLAKIRAQLRASIFLALSEEEELQRKEPLQNKKVKAQLQSHNGQLMFCLVREFLEFFDLDFTITVYEPESYLGSAYQYEGREKLIESLGLPQTDENINVPILAQLIKLVQNNLESNSSNQPSNSPEMKFRNKLSDQSNYHSQIENNKNYTSISEDLESANTSEHTSSKIPSDFPKFVTDIKTVPKENKLNVTFDVTSPMLKNDQKLDIQETPNDKKVSTRTGSLEGSINSRLSDEDIKSPKLSSQKTDKMKIKSSLSSLADLPPLQLNKSRGNDTMLLPSLYKKEKSNLKDLDKMLDLDFDSLDNYEEDFMSGTEIDFALNNTSFLQSDSAKVNLLDLSNSRRSPKDVLNTHENKSSSNSNVQEDPRPTKNIENETLKEVDTSAGSTITSEDFELNSNLEDILNSSSGSN